MAESEEKSIFDRLSSCSMVVRVIKSDLLDPEGDFVCYRYVVFFNYLGSAFEFVYTENSPTGTLTKTDEFHSVGNISPKNLELFLKNIPKIEDYLE